MEPVSPKSRLSKISFEEASPKLLPIFEDLRGPDLSAVSPKSRNIRVMAQEPNIPKLNLGKSNSTHNIIVEKDKMRMVKRTNSQSLNQESPSRHVLTPKSSPGHAATLGIKQEEQHYTGLVNTPKFNYDFQKHLEKTLKECPDKEVSVESLLLLITDYCKRKVEKAFLDEKKPLKIRSADLINDESSRAYGVWKDMQDEEILLLPIKKRLAFIQSEATGYTAKKGKRSKWSDELISHIGELLQEANAEVFSNKFSAKELKVDIGIFVSKSINHKLEECSKVLRYLESSVQKEFTANLKPVIRGAFYDNIAVASLPGTPHPYICEPEFKCILDQVCCYEIVHGFYRSSCNFERIRFHRDGQEYPMELFLLENEANKQKAFLNRLVEECYKYGWNSKIPAKEQEDLIYHFSQLDRTRLNELFDDKRPNIEMLERMIDKKEITLYLLQTLWLEYRVKNIPAEAVIASYFTPLMKLFRVCTSSCWNIGDEFLRKRFPLLFKFPLWSRQQDQVSLDITIQDQENFKVVQTKCYGVYPRLNPFDKESTVVDKSRCFAKIYFKWDVGYKNGLYNATMFVGRIEISHETSQQDKWAVLKALTDYVQSEEELQERSENPKPLLSLSASNTPVNSSEPSGRR